MILEALCALADREKLIDQPAFQSVPVRWIIDLDEHGQFRTLTDTAYTVQEEGKRKPKVRYKRFSVPRRGVRSGMSTKPDFLVDNIQYVFGIQNADEKKLNIPMASYQKAFLSLLQVANADLAAEQLRSVIVFLGNDDEREQAACELKRESFSSKELVAFRVHGEFVHENQSICDWWSNRSTEAINSADSRQCLVCGALRPPVRLHDQLKIVGTGSGAPLVGFNERAFEKHGLSGNENAPVCRACMVAYVNALRRCLDDRYPRPDGDGTFPQQSILLSKDTTAVYWDDQSSELTGALWWLNNDDPSAVKAILQSAWKGERPAFSEARFYCLILTGVKGRAVVRGMHTTTIEKISKHVESYFNCIEPMSRDGRPAPIYALLRSLVRKSDQKEHRKHLQPWLAAEVFLSAVLGKPLSSLFLAAAVGRIRAERDVTPPRAALLNLYFQRKGRGVPMSLDTVSTDPAYRYGRLLAVLEALQINYHNGRKPNSTIVDRFYAAASTRPATVFPRLLTLAQSHLKAASYANFYGKQITDVLEGLDGANGFRPTLSIEQQGRFALGYFHQRADRFKKSAQEGEIIPTSIEPATEENQA